MRVNGHSRCSSPVIGILHLVEKLIQLIFVSDWFKDLLAIQIISDVGIILVPLHRDVADGVTDVL